MHTIARIVYAVAGSGLLDKFASLHFMSLREYGTPITSRTANSEFRHILPGCRGEIVQDGGETICTSCGAAYARQVDYEEERRSTSQSTWSFHPTSLGTSNVIRTSNIRTTNLHPQYNKEVKLMEMIDRIATSLNLPSSTRMIAARLAIKVLRNQTSKRTSLLPICIYAIVQVCRTTEAHRSLTQILKAAQICGQIEQEQIFREFNRITSRSNVSYTNSTPEDYINSIINKLGQSLQDRIYLRAVQLRAQDILGSTRNDWQGKSPIRVATYCIYEADVELGYKIGIDLLCSVTQTSPEILKTYASKIGSPSQAKAGVKEAEALFEKESRTFKLFLTR